LDGYDRHRTLNIRPEVARVSLAQSECGFLERAAGIEPASLAWKAKVLPLHNARTHGLDNTQSAHAQHPLFTNLALVYTSGQGAAPIPDKICAGLCQSMRLATQVPKVVIVLH
jgi:hypothetical protein